MGRPLPLGRLSTSYCCENRGSAARPPAFHGRSGATERRRTAAPRVSASRVMRRRPTATLPRPAARAPHRLEIVSSGVSMSSRCRSAKLARLDHDCAGTRHSAARRACQALQHRQVGLLPGVVFRCGVPIHAGDGGALRRTWKAARAGGAHRSLRLHLESRWASSSVENAHQRLRLPLEARDARCRRDGRRGRTTEAAKKAFAYFRDCYPQCGHDLVGIARPRHGDRGDLAVVFNEAVLD